MNWIDIRLGGRPSNIDLDRLTPTARSLAEAIADTAGRHAGDIWMEADTPIRDTTPGWEVWFTPEEAGRPERRPWRGWSAVPLGPAEDPHDRLEYEARKIPPGWHVLGASPRRPLPSAGPIREGSSAQVLEYLRQRGRQITPATWRSYVGRGQAPAPVRHVGRTPMWDLDEVARWNGDDHDQ
jgi:hypothetical protein